MGVSLGSTKEGACGDLMKEYATILEKYGTTGKLGWTKFEKNISSFEQQRLEQIFKQMSIAQQSKQKVAFIKPPPPLKKLYPPTHSYMPGKMTRPMDYGLTEKKRKMALLNVMCIQPSRM